MAQDALILKDAYVAINGTAWSNFCSAATIESTFDEVDTTGFGAIYRQIAQGLGDGTITLTMFTDNAHTVDAAFWPLSQSGGTFSVEVRPTSAAVSSTNPKYTMTARLFGYNPIAGAAGDASTTDVPLRNAGTAGIARGTT